MLKNSLYRTNRLYIRGLSQFLREIKELIIRFCLIAKQKKKYKRNINLQKLIKSKSAINIVYYIYGRIIQPHPNTYTYSKRLAEKVVADKYPELPVAIARPSIGKSIV